MIDVAGDEIGRFGVGPRKDDRRNAHDVRGKPRGNQLVDRFTRRHEHLAAHVAAFLHRRELILEMHTGSTGVDHGFHQLERVQHAAEARFRVRDDWRKEVDVHLAFHVLNLIGAQKRVVDAADDFGH